MYLEVIKKSHKGKMYKTALIRQSFRKAGKVLHKTIANISELSDAQIENIGQILKSKNPIKFEDLNNLKTFDSKEFGASKSILSIIRELNLDRIIYSRKIQVREDILAMIIGRLIYPGSKLSLVNIFADSALWTLCGHSEDRPDVNDNCYVPLDFLLSRQEIIQNQLADKHLKQGCVVLYDLTSSYVEGEYDESELVTFGYNRDHKKGHEQFNIGLLTTHRGCPIAVETFAGNVPDKTTVSKQVSRIKDKFNVKSVIFVGDRGMLPPKQIEEVNAKGFKTITALSHKQIEDLLERKIVTKEMFVSNKIMEAKENNIRYLTCFNPLRKQEEGKTREALLKKTEEQLIKLQTMKRRKKIKDICANVGIILDQYAMKKFFNWEVKEEKLIFSRDKTSINEEAAIDGFYIIRTDVDETVLSTIEVVKSYKNLAHVEKAFRNIKTVSLHIRPVYHHLDDRIKAHVFLCMLAYYVQWHMTDRLEPFLKNNSKGKDRRWTFDNIIERLKSIRIAKHAINDIVIDNVKTIPCEDQEEILKLLKVSL
jgi:transposase